MDAAETLALVAEISVAFAGFTGLVGAFRPELRASPEHQQETRVLMEYSLITLGVALGPLVLFHMGVEEDHTWRIASGLTVFQIVVYYFWRGRELNGQLREKKRFLLYGFVLFDVVFTLGLLVNALGLSPWQSSALYLANLTYLVAGTALSFLRFASPMWTGAATAPGDDHAP